MRRLDPLSRLINLLFPAPVGPITLYSIIDQRQAFEETGKGAPNQNIVTI